MAATPPQLYMVIRINTTLLLEKNESTGGVYGVSNITSSELIPIGYGGVCARLYTSTGALSRSGSWHYNGYEVNGMGSGALDAPSSGTYYSKGQVRFL